MGGIELRDILFRGKRVDNGEWVYGNLIVRKGMPYRLFIFLPQNWKTTPLPILRKKKWTNRQRLERKAPS